MTVTARCAIGPAELDWFRYGLGRRVKILEPRGQCGSRQPRRERFTELETRERTLVDHDRVSSGLLCGDASGDLSCYRSNPCSPHHLNDR
jgi:hypothetical protein